MAYVRKYSETITINSTANTTGYIPATGFINGRVHTIIHTPGTVPFSTNGDVLMVSEVTSQAVLTVSSGSTGLWTLCPRQNIVGTTAATTAGHTAILLCDERIKVNITGATVGNSGTFTVLVE